MIKVAVVGSGDRLPEGTESYRARAVGRVLAERGAKIYTGGCWGLPYEAVQGAREVEGAGIIGISPGVNVEEHQHRFGFPIEGFTGFIYPWQQGYSAGLIERNAYMIKLADAVVALRGMSGTLTEISFAMHEGRNIGILFGEDGWDEEWMEIFKKPQFRSRMRHKKVVYDNDPESLVRRLLE